MTMAGALSLPMAQIAMLLGEGKLKARALAEEAIANHERFGAKLMAYSQWAPEHARKCADAADAAFAVGSRAGSLQGIPTSIKDLFGFAGFPTYAGSPKRLPPKFEIDGPVVANLRRQLATVMGKTHMVEFAFGPRGGARHYGLRGWSWGPPIANPRSISPVATSAGARRPWRKLLEVETARCRSPCLRLRAGAWAGVTSTCTRPAQVVRPDYPCRIAVLLGVSTGDRLVPRPKGD